MGMSCGGADNYIFISGGAGAGDFCGDGGNTSGTVFLFDLLRFSCLPANGLTEADDTFEGRALGGPSASSLGYGTAFILLFGGPDLSLTSAVKVGVLCLISKVFSLAYF